MPRLIEYISVGFCSGYGDGDYRVSSMEVRKLSRARFDELKLATLAALRCAEDNWRDEAAKAHDGTSQAAIRTATAQEGQDND